MKMSSEARLPAGQPAHATERGAGDWSNYQPPSAVLAAIAAKQGPRPPGKFDARRMMIQHWIYDISEVLAYRTYKL